MLNETPEAVDYVASLGYREAPVVVVTDGDKVIDSWSGFSLDRINALKGVA